MIIDIPFHILRPEKKNGTGLAESKLDETEASAPPADEEVASEE
jgi:hypothetical protein